MENLNIRKNNSLEKLSQSMKNQTLKEKKKNKLKNTGFIKKKTTQEVKEQESVILLSFYNYRILLKALGKSILS